MGSQKPDLEVKVLALHWHWAKHFKLTVTISNKGIKLSTGQAVTLPFPVGLKHLMELYLFLK